MRLTLRTLLAYIDKVLDPSEAQNLGDKVQKGKVARRIIDRINQVTHSPKLPAPKIGVIGTVNDPNPVAEYLDNTLDSKAIAAFEEKCLSDDSRLAEVADCHRILTFVLNNAADVSPELRRKILELPSTLANETDRGEQSDVDVTKTRPLPRVVEISGKLVRVEAELASFENSESQPIERKTGSLPRAGIELDDNLASRVPEYLRGGPATDWVTPAMISALVLALLFVAGLSLGSIEEIKSLLAWKGSEIAELDPGEVRERQDVVAPQLPSDELLAPELSSMAELTQTPNTDQKQDIPEIESSKVSQTVEDSPAIENTPKAQESLATNVAGAPDQPQSASIGSEASTETLSANGGAKQSVSPEVVALGVVPEPAPNSLAVELPERAQDSTSISVDKTNSEKGKLAWTLAPAEDSNPLVFSIGTSGEFERIQENSSLDESETIVIPPAMRTQFSRGTSLTWIAADESIIRLGETAIDANPEVKSASKPMVSITLGRALIGGLGPTNELMLETPSRTLNISSKDDRTYVAVEVRYQRNPGYLLNNTAMEPFEPKADSVAEEYAAPSVKVFAIRGTVELALEDDSSVKMELGEGVEWIAKQPARPWKIDSINNLPWWFDGDAARPIDEQASEQWRDLVAAADPKLDAAGILELARKCRFGEVVALGLRTQILQGNYVGLIGAESFLSSSMARPHRYFVLDTLYQCLSVGRERRKMFEQLVAEREPERSVRLLELASLPNDQQLADGFDRQLVEALTSPFVDERSLALYQLGKIHGKELGYTVDRYSNESLQAWRRLLNSQKVRW